MIGASVLAHYSRNPPSDLSVDLVPPGQGIWSTTELTHLPQRLTGCEMSEGGINPVDRSENRSCLSPLEGINPASGQSVNRPVSKARASRSRPKSTKALKPTSSKATGARSAKAVGPNSVKELAAAGGVSAVDEGKMLRSRRLGDEGLTALLAATAAEAEEEKKLRKEERTRLDRFVSSFGYQVRAVRADGSCWCAALAIGILSQLPDMGTSFSPERVREITVDALLANAEELLNYLSVTGSDSPTLDLFRAECELARHHKFWRSETSSIGDLLLEGFSRGTGWNVRVLRDDGCVVLVGVEGDRRTVTVGYFCRYPEHYCGLIPTSQVTGDGDSSQRSEFSECERNLRIVTRGVATTGTEDGDVSVEPASLSSVKPTSGSEGATGSHMDVNQVEARSRPLKRALQDDSDRVSLRCVDALMERDIEYLSAWRTWWRSLLRGHRFTVNSEVTMLCRRDSVASAALVDEFLGRCVLPMQRNGLRVADEVLLLSYFRRLANVDLYNYTVALPRHHCWSVLQGVVALLRTVVDDYSVIPFTMKVPNVAFAVFVVSIVTRKGKAKKLGKCVLYVDALLRLLKDNAMLRGLFERWTLQVIREWYVEGECVFLAPATRQPVQEGLRYLPLVRFYSFLAERREPLLRYGVATVTPTWKPVVAVTKAFNLLGGERMDWPEIAVVCEKGRVPTTLMEWTPSGVRKCVTLGDARQQDQDRRRLLLAEVHKDAEAFREVAKGTACSAMFLSSADVVRSFLDETALSDFVILDADDVIDLIRRWKDSDNQGTRALFWWQEAQNFEAALTMTERELVRGVSERAVAAGVLYDGKALEDVVEGLIKLK